MSDTSTVSRLVQMLFFALVVRPFMLLFIGLRVRGLDNLPEKDPFILIANHSSHLDTISLLSLFPLKRLSRVRPCAAADYFDRPGISAFTRLLFNILPIARKGITRENNPIAVMREALARGESLILFPEGTRGGGEEPAAFKSGVAHLVEEAPGVPVVPAYLVNMGRSLPKGEIVPVPFFCQVRLGPPIKPCGSRAEILPALEHAVRALKDESNGPA